MNGYIEYGKGRGILPGMSAVYDVENNSLHLSLGGWRVTLRVFNTNE